MDHYRWDGDNLILHCHLQPNAARDEFAGLHGERLKVRIGAPPVDGKANAQLIEFLSRAFNVAKTDVSILKGKLGRQKTVCIRAPQKLPEGSRIK